MRVLGDQILAFSKADFAFIKAITYKHCPWEFKLNFYQLASIHPKRIFFWGIVNGDCIAYCLWGEKTLHLHIRGRKILYPHNRGRKQHFILIKEEILGSWRKIWVSSNFPRPTVMLLEPGTGTQHLLPASTSWGLHLPHWSRDHPEHGNTICSGVKF